MLSFEYINLEIQRKSENFLVCKCQSSNCDFRFMLHNLKLLKSDMILKVCKIILLQYLRTKKIQTF